MDTLYFRMQISYSWLTEGRSKGLITTVDFKRDLRSRQLKTTGNTRKSELLLRLKEFVDIKRKHRAFSNDDDDTIDEDVEDEKSSDSKDGGRAD